MSGKKTRTVREYINRQPRVGDNIVVTDQVGILNVQPIGSELTIISVKSLSGEHVHAFSPRKVKMVVLHDDEYRIYVDAKYEKVGEDDVVKKFLGIPYGKHAIEKWRKVRDD